MLFRSNGKKRKDERTWMDRLGSAKNRFDRVPEDENESQWPATEETGTQPRGNGQSLGASVPNMADVGATALMANGSINAVSLDPYRPDSTRLSDSIIEDDGESTYVHYLEIVEDAQW